MLDPITSSLNEWTKRSQNSTCPWSPKINNIQIYKVHAGIRLFNANFKELKSYNINQEGLKDQKLERTKMLELVQIQTKYKPTALTTTKQGKSYFSKKKVLKNIHTRHIYIHTHTEGIYFYINFYIFYSINYPQLLFFKLPLSKHSISPPVQLIQIKTQWQTIYI